MLNGAGFSLDDSSGGGAIDADLSGYSGNGFFAACRFDNELILEARDAFAGGFAFRFRLSALYLQLRVLRLAHVRLRCL